jgi:AraC-like DNA-binding protein
VTADLRWSTQGGQQARLSATEFALYDTRRPYEVACGVGAERPVRLLTFMFSPSLLPLSPSRLPLLTAVRIPATTGLASRPVAAIAASWGFSSAADFSRAFRAAHGMPPGEYRRSARVANSLAR